MYTISLNSPLGLSVCLVGSKASRLSELCLNDFPVPDGFSVTAEAFEKFCTHNNINDDMTSKSSEGLANKIIECDFPDYLRKKIDL